MTKHPKINFEYNCNQRASAFQHVNGLAFCKLCQTSIINLTDKSKEQIINIVKQNNGQICGQFFLEQISDKPSTKRQVGLKVVLASVATFLTVTATKVAAQANNSIKTEQHDTTFASIKKEENQVIEVDTSCTAFANGEQCSLPNPDGKNKKSFMKIGRRYFYTTNKFPFITSKKIFRGKLKF